MGPQSMLMRNRSPVSHVLCRSPLVQLALLHQREFLVFEVNNLSSHNCLPQARGFRQSPWFFFFIYFCGGAGRFYGILVYVQTRACVAQSILLLLLSALLLIPIPLRFKLKLENQWKHPLESYNILVTLVGVFSSQGQLGGGTKLVFGEQERGACSIPSSPNSTTGWRAVQVSSPGRLAWWRAGEEDVGREVFY